MLTLASWLSPDFVKMAEEQRQPVLITIPYSHYVELSRWALQLAGRKFIEMDYAPFQHVAPVLSVRACRPIKHIASSSYVQKVRTEKEKASKAESKLLARKRSPSAGATSVPLLVTSDGRVLTDSWAIVAESGLAPISDSAAQKMYDEELGPLARQWFYHHILKQQHRRIWDDLLTRGRHWLFLVVYWLGLRSYIYAYMVRTFKAHDADAIAECRVKLHALVERIAATRLRERTGRFLSGPTLGVEDIALAALGAPLVNPPAYCEGRFAFATTRMEATDEELQRELKKWRSTEFGQFVLSTYADFRTQALAPGGSGGKL